MAEENARPDRGRKQAKESLGEAEATPTTSKVTKPRKAEKTKTTAKKAAAKPAAAKPRTPHATRRASVAHPMPEAIAEHAYLLWERGEPGDETEHWLRAEAELRAA